MSEMMDAIVFSGIGKWELSKIPKPKIEKQDEVLIKVEAAAICGTDVHILENPPSCPAGVGTVLGHEFVGEIVEKGADVTAFSVGDRVMMDNNVPCGTCYFCKIGHISQCENVTMLGVFRNGFFAQYTASPASGLARISKDVPAHQAALTEPVTCVMGGIAKARLIPGETAVVIGGGPSGLLFASLYKANGARKVILVQRSKYRAELAKKCGIDRVVSPLDEDVYEVILEETKGLGADVVTDAVGSQMNAAIKYVRAGGRIILYGLNSNAEQTMHQYDITRKDITVRGSFLGPHQILDAVNVVESGLIEHTLEALVTHKLPLREFGKGIEALRKSEAMKVVLYPFK